MENRGLCVTCVHEKKCIFTKDPPILQCEEFSDYESIKEPIRLKAAPRQGKTKGNEETETLE